MSETKDDPVSWDAALDAVTAELSKIESGVHGMMPTATWLEVVRMHVDMLHKQPVEVVVSPSDEARLTSLEARMDALFKSVVDMQTAIVEATSHKDMQASVAEVTHPGVAPEA
jgi:hypothetical protein